MNAKHLTVALLVSLVVSGTFAFLLSRQLAKAARSSTSQKQFVVAAGKALEAGEVLQAGNPAVAHDAAVARGAPPPKPTPYQAKAVLGDKQMVKILN